MLVDVVAPPPSLICFLWRAILFVAPYSLVVIFIFSTAFVFEWAYLCLFCASVCLGVGVCLHLPQSHLKNLIECVINWNCQLKSIGWIIQVYHSCLWQDQAVKWFYYKQYGSKCNRIKALMLLKGHETHDGIKYLFLPFLPAERNSTTLLSTYYYIKWLFLY